MGEFGIGQPVRRKEDVRFLTGLGRYTDDIDLDGQAHVCFLRSPYAHARIRAIDTTQAAAAGVVAIYTGADIESDNLPPIPCSVQVKDRNGVPMYSPARPALAVDRVRFAGDLVAMVIAETRSAALDAAELIDLDVEELPAIVDTAAAAEADAPRIWPDCGSNICVHWENRDPAGVAPIFETAAHVAEVDLVINRVMANPMEPKCALAEYDAEGDVSTLYCPSQGVHRIHRNITGNILKIPPEKLRIVSHDVGGGFGVRSKSYPELVLMVWASKKLLRSLKWRAERSGTMVSDTHARDNVTRARLALDADGKALALWIDTIANMGAYLSDMAPMVPITVGQRSAGTAYVIPALYHSIRCVFTNSTPVDAYRGAGRPESAYVMERLMEAAAMATGVDAAEIRRRNLIPDSALPYTNTQNLVIDSGDFAATQEMALSRADWQGFGPRRAAAMARGKRRGIGIGNFLECSGGQPVEQARVRFESDGTVTAFAGTFSHGQGHETVFAQILSDKLGVPFDDINYVDGGDTTLVSFGHGTAGSRSSQMGGVALARACDRILEKGKRIAGNLLQASAADIRFEAGTFQVSDGAGSVTIQDVARAASDPARLPAGIEAGLDETYLYEREPGLFNYPNGCHVAEVEVDPETGAVEVVRYTAVDDNGTVLNPMIVHGQVQGAIAQGLGQALFERTVYDRDTGQLLTASFLDYPIPRATDVPPLDVSSNEIPCATNDLGVKGAGEGGCCGAPSAIVNAVVDALGDLGVRNIQMPLTPERVWRAINHPAE